MAKQAINLEAIETAAEQVGRQVIMGPAYSDPALLERMGIKVISGIQFKRIDTVLVRKGGETRRKKVGTPVSNSLGILKERKLVTYLAASMYKDNVARFRETVFGTDSTIGNDFPLYVAFVEAILKSYAEDLTANLFFGDPANDEIEGKKHLSLFVGFHTGFAEDIANGEINTAKGNLVPCDAISEPVDSNDSSPFDAVLSWYTKWDPRLRQSQRIILYCDVLRGVYIAQGYANRYHGVSKVIYLPNGNFTVPEMPRVEFCPSDVWGKGDRLAASIPDNLQYGVDNEGNQQFVSVRLGSDDDHNDISFQIQSAQGTRLLNPQAAAFVMSDGNIESCFMSGDYDNSKLVVSVNDPALGAVKVNGSTYDTPQEFAPNEIVTLKAEPTETNQFERWSNGKTDAQINIVATGMPMAITAFFKAAGA